MSHSVHAVASSYKSLHVPVLPFGTQLEAQFKQCRWTNLEGNPALKNPFGTQVTQVAAEISVWRTGDGVGICLISNVALKTDVHNMLLCMDHVRVSSCARCSRRAS